MTRATVRAGTRAVLKNAAQAAKKAAGPAKPRRAATPGSPADRSSGVAVSPAGARRYQFYKPPEASTSAPLPLLVMLHGCGADAGSFARSTRLHRLAAREGFFVLYPEQDRLANAHGCWNWFDTRSHRAFGEAASIMAAIDQVCARHRCDPARVAVAGMSAGASMAALLALRYPQRFKAVAMHSGVAPGTAHSSTTALSAMQGRRQPTALPITAAGLPPLLVIHGTADRVVRASNGRAAAQMWADAASAHAGAVRTVQRGKRYPMTVTDFKRKDQTVVSLCEVSGLGHAWSGGASSQPYSDAKGPDASRLIWAFAARHFRLAGAGPLA